MNRPQVSICIPCYKRVEFLKRLLESIAVQSFKDFEVIISDDTPGEEVRGLSQQYESKFAIRYFKNAEPRGTPGNWNEGIHHALGEWIKLMHDDDWFSSSESLKAFVDNTAGGCKFIFSGYTRTFENNPESPTRIVRSRSSNKNLTREPGILFAENVIGPPSVTLVHRSVDLEYDEKLKWLVDVDFYMRLLEQEKAFTYIERSLINIGMHESQVTRSSINDPRVELPEAWIILKKQGVRSLKNIWVYDAWWRLFRNMNIKSDKQLLSYVDENWPKVILRIIRDVRRVPSPLLKWGATSKVSMALSYLTNGSTIK